MNLKMNEDLLTIIDEKNFNIKKDLHKIIERAINSNPHLTIPVKENAFDCLVNLEKNAEFSAVKNYNILIKNGFAKFLDITSPYLRFYFNQADIEVIKSAYNNKIYPEKKKKKLLNIFRYAFIKNRFSLIVVDCNMFLNN